jgi:hypothetical protein
MQQLKGSASSYGPQEIQEAGGLLLNTVNIRVRRSIGGRRTHV